jgi:hypothetical protein
MAKKPEKKAVKKVDTLAVMLLAADRKSSLGTMSFSPKDLKPVVGAIKKYATRTTGAFEK